MNYQVLNKRNSPGTILQRGTDWKLHNWAVLRSGNKNKEEERNTLPSDDLIFPMLKDPDILNPNPYQTLDCSA